MTTFGRNWRKFYGENIKKGGQDSIRIYGVFVLEENVRFGGSLEIATVVKFMISAHLIGGLMANLLKWIKKGISYFMEYYKWYLEKLSLELYVV